MNSHHREETLFSLVIGVQSCIISVFWCRFCHFLAATRRPHGTLYPKTFLGVMTVKLQKSAGSQSRALCFYKMGKCNFICGF